MKTLTIAKVGALALGLLATFNLEAQTEEEPVVILLVDPEEDPPASKELPTNPNSEVQSEQAPTLEELIEQARREQSTLNEYQERVLETIQREQTEFGKLLVQFLEAEFNPQDPKGNPTFNASVERIVKLLFKAPTTRSYYSRIYLINKLWLENRPEKPRFDVLDRALQDEALRLEARNRKIRQALIGITTVAGLGIGGYFGYKAAYSMVKVSATESGLASISKTALRGGIIVVFATTGAAAGAFAGFLGSDFLLSHSRELLDPIDEGEHYTELLEYVDDL